MSKYFVTTIFLIVLGVVLSNAYKTTLSKDELDQLRQKREAVEVKEDIKIKGKDDDESGNQTNQGLIAMYWNSFLNRARQPLQALNFTNPLTNLLTPYVVEVDHPPEHNQNQEEQLLTSQSQLILLDPTTNQYYRVQPINS